MMLKFTSLLLLTASLIPANVASAEKAYEPWLKFFEGEWEWSADNEMAGEITFECANKKVAALLTRFKMSKPQSIESFGLMGWDAHEKKIIDTGFNSRGAHGESKYTVMSSEKLEGKWTSNEADGSVRKMKYLLKRVDDDTYVLEIGQAESKDKKDTWTKITVTRKK